MDWLKEFRIKKRMTQKTVAQSSGISRAAYANIELGKRKPSVKVAQAIAEILEFNWVLFFK